MTIPRGSLWGDPSPFQVRGENVTMSDPVAALRDAMGLGGPGVTARRDFNEFTLRQTADALRVLAEQGYVLVNAEGLAVAAGNVGPPKFIGTKFDAHDQPYEGYYDWEGYAAAILAAIQEGYEAQEEQTDE